MSTSTISLRRSAVLITTTSRICKKYKSPVQSYTPPVKPTGSVVRSFLGNYKPSDAYRTMHKRQYFTKNISDWEQIKIEKEYHSLFTKEVIIPTFVFRLFYHLKRTHEGTRYQSRQSRAINA